MLGHTSFFCFFVFYLLCCFFKKNFLTHQVELMLTITCRKISHIIPIHQKKTFQLCAFSLKKHISPKKCICPPLSPYTVIFRKLSWSTTVNHLQIKNYVQLRRPQHHQCFFLFLMRSRAWTNPDCSVHAKFYSFTQIYYFYMTYFNLIKL